MENADEKTSAKLGRAPSLPPNATGRPVLLGAVAAILLQGAGFSFGSAFLSAAGFYALIVAATGHHHWFDPYMVAVLGLLGLVLLASSLAEGRRTVRFFRNAQLAWGIVVDIEQRTSEWTERNGKSLVDRHRTMVWEEVRLAFNDSKGTRHRTIIDVKSSEPLTDDRYELVLYDPEYPAHAQAVDDPATCVDVTTDGKLKPKSSPYRKLVKLLVVSGLIAGFAVFVVHQ